MVIDKHENKEKKIETGISRGFSLLLIIFLIYISRVFYKVTKTCSLVTSLSFINNLGLITSDNLVKKVVKTLKK